MLYSRGRTHLRVSHTKDLISSEQQQTFQDQNSVEEHLKTVRVSRLSKKLIDLHVHRGLAVHLMCRTSSTISCLEIVLPIVTMFISSNSLWYFIVLVNRFKFILY